MRIIEIWTRKSTTSKDLIKTVKVKLYSPDGLQVFFNDGRWLRVSTLKKYYDLVK